MTRTGRVGKNLSLLSEEEVNRAQNGPRELKSPTSREYAIQTMRHLSRMLSSLKYDEDHVRKELAKIEQYRHWEVLGYPTREALLDAELGELSELARQRLSENEELRDRIANLEEANERLLERIAIMEECAP